MVQRQPEAGSLLVQAIVQTECRKPCGYSLSVHFGRSAVSISSRAKARGASITRGRKRNTEIVLRRVASHLAQRTAGDAGISTLRV